MRGALTILDRRFDAVASLMSTLAGWGFFLGGGLIAFDVLTRNVFGFSSRATLELSGYLLAIGISWSLAHTFSERAHVRVDVLVARLPLRLRAPTHLIAILLLATVAAFFAWGAVALAWESFEFGARDRSAVETPLVIPQALWAAGLAFFALRLVLALLLASAHYAAGAVGALDKAYGPRTYEEEAAESLDALRVGVRP